MMNTNRVEGEQISIGVQGVMQARVEKLPTVTIINVVCKLFMMVLRDIINGCVAECGMQNDRQGCFRMGRRTGDNLCMLEGMIEMVKIRKGCLFVVFIDMEKAYDKMNRKKLFEVMRGYGVQELLVDVIKRIYV